MNRSINQAGQEHAPNSINLMSTCGVLTDQLSVDDDCFGSCQPLSIEDPDLGNGGLRCNWQLNVWRYLEDGIGSKDEVEYYEGTSLGSMRGD